MLLEPPIDELIAKAEGNPYRLAVLVGKTASKLDKELNDEQKEQDEVVNRAVHAYYDGKIVEKK